MAQPTTLTEKQIAVLRWIASGCPDGVMDGEFHRITAGALRRRELVTTSGGGPTWTAKVTKAGRAYLARVDGPDPPIPRKPNGSVTQRLVDDVLAAGGILRVKQQGYGLGPIDYELRARMAQQHRKVPAGKHLVVGWVDGQTEIRLVDGPGPDPEPPLEIPPVVIPKRITRYHAVARAFRDRTAHYTVSRQLLPRAVRIVHVIAVEAEQRGWTVTDSIDPNSDARDRRWRDTTSGDIRITVGDHAFWLRLQEAPSDGDDADQPGRLQLELHPERYARYRGRQRRWADRKSWALEERLPHLLREIEDRALIATRVAEERRVAAEKEAQEARRRAEERERTWHRLMAQARERLIETDRATRLRAQADAWHEADRLRSYCDALSARYGEHPDAAEWVAWARAHADSLDPLTTAAPTMPPPPEPTVEALQKHLPTGWSAEGPEESHRHRGISGRYGS